MFVALRINRYLYRELSRAAIATFIVVILLFLSYSAGFLVYEFVRFNLPVRFLWPMLALELPEMTLNVATIALYLGVVLTLNGLNARNETAVLYALGLGQGYMVARVARWCVLPFVAIAYLAAVGVPAVYESKRELLHKAYHEINIRLDANAFHTFPGASVYVGERINPIDDANTKNAYADWFVVVEPSLDNDGFAITAKEGAIIERKGAFWLVLEAGYRYQQARNQDGNMQTNIANFARLEVPLAEYLAIETRARIQNPVRGQSLAELWANRANTTARSELWWRASYVVSGMLACLLAVFLVPYRPRQARFANVLPALLVFVVYSNGLGLVRDKTNDGVWPVDTAYLSLYGLLIVCVLIAWGRAERWGFGTRLSTAFGVVRTTKAISP